MGRNLALEDVLSILNDKQTAEGFYFSCGPPVTPVSCCKQVAWDDLQKQVLFGCGWV